MAEVQHLEPKHLTGKGGIGKGCQRRRGADDEAYRAGWDRTFGPQQKESDEAVRIVQTP